MRHSPSKIAAMLQANVEALNSQRITFDQFTRVNRATWDLVNEYPRRVANVNKALVALEWGGAGFDNHSTRRIGRNW